MLRYIDSSKFLREAAFIIGGAMFLFFFAALLTYADTDPSFSSTHVGATANWGGVFGAHIAALLFELFGNSAYLLILMFLLFWRVLLFRPFSSDEEGGGGWWWGIVGVVLFAAATAALEYLRFHHSAGLPAGAGGWIGNLVARGMTQWFGAFGASLLLLAIWMLSWSLVLGLSWLAFFECLGGFTEKAVLWIFSALTQWRAARVAAKPASPTVTPPTFSIATKTAAKRVLRKAPRKKTATQEGTAAQSGELDLAQAADALPSLTLLDAPAAGVVVNERLLRETSELIERSLSDFNVSVKVVAAHPGPVITRYDLQPATGVKGAQIVNLTRDLARSLSVNSIRVLETIPGANTIGLEIPNKDRATVGLSEVLSSDAYQNSAAALPLALGKTAAGKAAVVDLATMPHLLVAGSTGSGKSVFINAMLLSLLFARSPQQLRLLLIDPKMLELSAYANIPHLLAPVVTDMTQAPAALHWVVEEMERRYQLMATAGVRHISSYNAAVEAGKIAADEDGVAPTVLRFLVVVIDELADLMMVAGKKVELSINRLAQKARAAGIHLVLATQRPSVDVITGLIKANVPCRLSFQVVSKIDSRTILDQMGAETLLGKGDMLYLPPGAGVPQRLHGAFVSDEEARRVVAGIRRDNTDYEVDFGGITAGDVGNDAGGGGAGDGEKDEMYDQAVEAVMESRRASISLVQRKLRVGYNRAARLMESMESAGLVSPMDEFGARKVLIPKRDGGR